MAYERKTYNVYGHKVGNKGKKGSEWLGTVKDYNATYALATAKKEYKGYVVKKVIIKRW